MRSVMVLGPLLAVSCGSPRVAKVAGADGTNESEGTTDPGWDDETTSKPSLDDGAEAGEGADDGPRYDVIGPGDKLDVPPYQHDCPEPLPSTSVEGQTALGAFDGVHAYFGDAWGEVDLVLYDQSANLDHELDYAGVHGTDIDVGPAIRGTLVADWEQLPVQDVFTLAHITADEELWFMAEVTITEAEFDDGDPFVPAVVHGSIAPWPQDATDAVSGSFSASRCGVFEIPFPIE